MSPRRGTVIPRATYRLQFRYDFTFDDAAALIPYLDQLGISHCYASPYLRARAGSEHGYDIVDHNALNPEIGDWASFGRFNDTLKAHGMGQILDVVPNHMGVGGSDNAWWLDVLENGPASEFAVFFDIDWHPIKEELRGRVLVPVLGDHYGTVLERGDIRLQFDARQGELSTRYFEHRFPLDPATYPLVLGHDLERLTRRVGTEEHCVLELQSLITAFTHLPLRDAQATEALTERRRDKEMHKLHLRELCERCPPVAQHIEAAVRHFNGHPDRPSSFDALHHLLEQQAYRLAYWQVASDEINYRRFFDINDLAGVRMEEPVVFATTHRLVLSLIADGTLEGLRVDHPDGLYDPLLYYRWLQRGLGERRGAQRAEGSAPRSYLLVEKILAGYERLPEEWPVHGTTGYEFANAVNGLLIHPDGERDLDHIYSRILGHRTDFDELLYQCKRTTVRVQLSSELTVLANMLNSIAQRDRHTRDFTLNGLREAITEVVACFPVYRTYLNEAKVSEEDRRYVEWAVAQAKKRSPAGDISIYDFIRTILLERVSDPAPALRRRAARFAMKFQQYTAPVMAKALEDTTFYLYNRLISLNEVGGDPRRFALSPAAFHHANQERLQHWPHGMVSTSTHDSKRSEDVRARINVLSELPGQWQRHLTRWTRINRHRKTLVDSRPAPSRNDEYLLYQTVVGTWPLGAPDEEALADYRQRIRAYMGKAVKEAKAQTSWLNPNAEYERAVGDFVDALLTNRHGAFVNDLQEFVDSIAPFGLLNGLSQALLRLTVPGVPDTYQGCELWDFSLVDPDNRRPVDFELRRKWLTELQERADNDGTALCRELLARLHDGRAKLYLTWRALQLRRRRPELFTHGDYLPLESSGDRAGHLCAFARRTEAATAIVITPRWYARLGRAVLEPGGAVWGDTAVAAPADTPTVRHLFSGATLTPHPERGFAAAALFSDFPVALLLAEAAGH